MAVSSKLKRLDDDDIVQYGVEVPVAGVARGRGDTREIRDMAIAFGAVLNLPRPARTKVDAPAPAEAPLPAPAPPAATLPTPGALPQAVRPRPS